MAQAPTAHVPPQNIEAEESVLGAMLVAERALGRVIDEVKLNAEDFYLDKHRLIFATIHDLYAASKPVDELTVAEALTQAGTLEEAGGKHYVSTLAASVPAAGNAKHYAEIVQQNSLLRRLLGAGQRIQEMVNERDGGDPRQLAEDAERLLFQVAHEEQASDFRQVSEILSDELDRLEKLASGDADITGTPSGFRDIDAITGGFQPGNLVIFAARPAMGKCLRGSSRVYDPRTGARRRVDELFAAAERGEEVWVASLGPDLRMTMTKAAAVARNGRRQVYRLTTRLGRILEATTNHPVLTSAGWRELGRLEPGTRIAVPRELPQPTSQTQMEQSQTAVLDRLDAAPRSTNTDTVPIEVWAEVLLVKGTAPWASVSSLTGRPRNHNWHVRGRTLSRGLVAELATALDSPSLTELAHSDVWWDEVSSVESVGLDQTYDIDVPGLRNFVADDVVVHNSALVANIAEHVSLREGLPVAFFSLEMSEVELAQRFIACRARIAGDRLRRGHVGQKDWPKVVRACNELEQAPLWIDDSSDLGLLDLRAKARRLQAQEASRGGLGLIVVDYLQLMRPDDPRANRVEQVGQMSRGLKILARELDVPVLAISQLSRAPEQRHPPRPQLSDLRESGSIEQDADLVAFLYREDYYRQNEEEHDGLADVIIAKHRNGPTGTRKLVFLNRFPKFADYSGQERPLEQPAGEGPPMGDLAAEGPAF
jgi:replicative DNA helicase